MAISSGMRGRVWFGQGLIFDEIYQFLEDLAILDKPVMAAQKDYTKNLLLFCISIELI